MAHYVSLKEIHALQPKAVVSVQARSAMHGEVIEVLVAVANSAAAEDGVPDGTGLVVLA